MKKILFLMTLLITLAIGSQAQASTYDVHTVQRGDSLWKIAVKYEVGLSEIINENPEIKNPNLIYPGQKVKVPRKSEADTSVQNEILSLVNAERSKVGLNPLKLNWELSRVAKIKSEDMAHEGYFSHTSPTYGTPFEMMKHFGIKYKTAGENIAAGQKTPKEVMVAWMNSKGHRENILNKKYTEIGVGYFKGGSYGSYWTQQFIGN